MQDLQVFSYEGGQVTTVIVDGELWFLANDVCQLLGYVNPRDAVARHCKEKGVAKHDTPTQGGMQSRTYINEPNLYRLITKSKLPSADKFEAWVFEEVLPAIRKTGSYSIQPQPALPQTYLEALKELVAKTEQAEALQAKVLEDAPKVEGYEQLMSSEGLLSIQQVARLLGWSPNKFFAQLRADGYLMDGKRLGKDRHNLPYSQYAEWFEVKVKGWAVGNTSGTHTRVWVTSKGLDRLRVRYAPARPALALSFSYA